MIRDAERLREVIKTVRFQCDLRREAMNNRRPFAEDPFMVDFCSAMLRFPHMLHVSALWLDDQLLAYHMGIEDGRLVTLGMISYDPSESRLSPGTLLLVKLAEHLTDTGYQVFDLTPGADSYKDRFANDYQTRYRPTFFFSKTALAKEKIKKRLASGSKRLLALAKVDNQTMRRWKTDLRTWKSKWRKISWRTTLSFLAGLFFRAESRLVYEIDLAQYPNPTGRSCELRQQDYAALLNYQGTQPYLIRRDLLVDALNKFSGGEVLFSKMEEERLQWFAWMKDAGETTLFPGFPKAVAPVPDNAKILYDFYASPTVQPLDFSQNLMEVLERLKEEGEQKVCLWMTARHKLSDREMERLRVASFQKHTLYSLFHFFKEHVVS